ncbi:MAG: TIGR03905 family TSCPD domain-containing protein [Lachnospiraceae bacterium]|nr:TIGR03905 family TSCPD domain-containing protein [Lachnospiraceae bacterium]
MHYTYQTRGTCSTKIVLDIEGDVVHNVAFTGGCNGNLQAIPKLVEGLTVEQIEQKVKGISCNGRGTSCADQLAKACREAYELSLKQ